MAIAAPIEKIELYGNDSAGQKRRVTVVAGTQISQGILVQLTSPNTASATTSGTIAQGIAGVMSMEKEAGDDVSTESTVWTLGKFRGTASAAITAGDELISASDNFIMLNPGNIGVSGSLAGSGSAIIGYSVETVANNARCDFILKL